VAKVGWYVTNSRAVVPDVRVFLGRRVGPSADVRTLSNPVDFDRFESLAAGSQRGDLPEVPVFISVGRLSKEKRPDVLIEAFDRIHQRRPARLVVCGDGPLRPWLACEINRRGLVEDVDLMGFQENPWVVMRQATALLLTSDYEGLPNALIEAQGLGLPAVATRAGGAAEVIAEGETGFLVPAGDAVAVANAAERFLIDPDLARAMSLAASRRARRLFGIDTVIRSWEDLLEECRGAVSCAE
jgi:glycosyltransferase involved in cell wall biosynthesis